MNSAKNNCKAACFFPRIGVTGEYIQIKSVLKYKHEHNINITS